MLIFYEILPKKLQKKKKVCINDFNIDGYDSVIPSLLDGRGVVIYYKTNLNIINVDILNNKDYSESVWLRVKLKNTNSLLIGSVYRSPSSSNVNNEKLTELIQSAVSYKDSHILILGDFNYRTIDWELMQSSESLQHASSKFIECINDTFLYQHVTEATRYRPGQSQSRLDLIFSNEYNMVNDLEYLPPIGASDHVCIFFNFSCYIDNKASVEPRYNFHKGDYTKMREILENTNWDTIDNMDSVGSWDFFSSTLISSGC